MILNFEEFESDRSWYGWLDVGDKEEGKKPGMNPWLTKLLVSFINWDKGCKR